MKRLPLAALIAATAVSTLIAIDIVWNAHHAGEVGPWLDAAAHPYLVRLVSLLHAGLYWLLVAALIQAGRAIDGGRRFIGVLRWAIIAGYAVFAVMYTWTAIVDPNLNPAGLFEIVVNIAFLVSLLLPIALGFALIRRREFRIPSTLLIAPILLLPLTLLLQAVGGWGHPGYMETAVNFGMALLCLAAVPASPHTAQSATDDAPAAAESGV